MIYLQLLFWLAIITILYTFFGYPILITLVTRYYQQPIKQQSITPHVTLLIAAYNEAAVIAQKIENSLALNYPPAKLTIAIVADGSNDETVDIATRYSSNRLTVYHQPQRQGKIGAINRAMPLLNTDIVVFTDANTMLQPNTIQTIVRNFADESVGGVAGEKRVASGGEGLYWRYESYLKKCDSALTSVMGAAGELFALRHHLFQPIEPDTLLDDFVISFRLVINNWRVVYEPQAVALELPSPSYASDWERRVRNSAGGFQAMARLGGLFRPSLGWVPWQYLSHRVLRWAVTPFLLPLVYILNLFLLQHPFYQLLWGLQTIFYSLALLGYILTKRNIQRGIPYIIFYFCFTNAAAILGFWRYLTKTQSVIWHKVR